MGKKQIFWVELKKFSCISMDILSADLQLKTSSCITLYFHQRNYPSPFSTISMASIDVFHYSDTELALYNDDLVEIVLVKMEEVFWQEQETHKNRGGEEAKGGGEGEEEGPSSSEDISQGGEKVKSREGEENEKGSRGGKKEVERGEEGKKGSRQGERKTKEMNSEDRKILKTDEMNWKKKEEELHRKEREETSPEREGDEMT
ncbi:hypothetical protein F5I97DRAFT_1829559 [Phlebopus sp. FC_14]|nr:hypothetical protein F5I97DRAFT_1829559 [Phlebopus sp. FC_14]